MKKVITLLTLISFSASLIAQKYVTRTGKVSFFSTTPIENIEAFNNEASGAIDASSGSVVFIIPIKSFKFEKALMQEHFNDNYMESDKYPKAKLNAKITDPSSVNYSKNGTYNVTVAGTMEIHGVTKKIKIPGTITVDGDNLKVSSKFKIKLADFNISIPSVAQGKIAESVEINVNSTLKKN